MAAVPKPPSNLSTEATATIIRSTWKDWRLKGHMPLPQEMSGTGMPSVDALPGGCKAATLQVLREGVFGKLPRPCSVLLKTLSFSRRARRRIFGTKYTNSFLYNVALLPPDTGGVTTWQSPCSLSGGVLLRANDRARASTS